MKQKFLCTISKSKLGSFIVAGCFLVFSQGNQQVKAGNGTLQAKSKKTTQVSVLSSGASSARISGTVFEDFNRANNNTLGSPSSGGTTTWLETETSGSNNYRARVENNMLVLSAYNNQSAGVSGTEQTSINVYGKYATTFSQAASNLVWQFNFRQSRTSPSGFGSGFYGVAYVLGSSEANFLSATANGYAVVIGNANSPDPVKLVRFTNGLSANSNLANIITTAEENVTAYYSVKVTYNPCSGDWSLQVRNDGTTAFADPSTITSNALVAKDQVFTNLNLPFIGAAFSHGTANEKAFFDNLYLPDAPTATPVTYTWTGSASTIFEDPANWSPQRTCNRVTDILSFSSGGTITVSNVTTQEIGKIAVANNTTVLLRAKTGATQTLFVLGGTGEDLTVAAGSSLVIDSNDPLEISLKTGTTGKINGSVVFQNTAANLGRAHRLLVTDANAIAFEQGSQFLAKNLSGEAFGNSGMANVITFRTGSVYISRDGASPFGLVTPTSKVVFETGSLYRHEQVGTAPKFDGRVYADFELNVTNSLAIIFGTSASNPTRIDNFRISSGTMNVSLASGSTPLNFQIRENLTIAPGALLNFSPAAAANTSLISFSGTKKQQISGNITLGTFANLEINNPAGIDLLSTLTVKGNLQLSNGNLTPVNAATLSLEDNATVSGASALSFVAGKIIKTGNDAFTFPTGKNGIYAPVGISAPLNTTDQYSAEYFPVNPNEIFGSVKNDSLGQISETEYWDLERLTGTSEVKVTLSYDANRSIMINNPEDLRIAHYSGNNGWDNVGKAEVVNLQNFTLVSTRNTQASYSPFTFATVKAPEPLPVSLVNFSAFARKDEVYLTWETATETGSESFKIERSLDGSKFEQIGNLQAAGNSAAAKQYQFFDKKAAQGKSYYRLKLVDLDGKFAYSKIVAVNRGDAANEIQLYPNPVADKLKIKLPPGFESGNVEIVNLIGLPVRTLATSGLVMEMDVSSLKNGTYLLRVSNNQETLVQRFMKVN